MLVVRGGKGNISSRSALPGSLCVSSIIFILPFVSVRAVMSYMVSVPSGALPQSFVVLCH